MKKNVAKMVMAVVLVGAMVTGQAVGVIPLPIGQIQQVQAAQVQRQTISAGRSHVAIIKEDGSLWTWGSNEHGQLGDNTTEDRNTPVKIMNDVVFVSAGYGHTAAIKSDGSLWTWGSNDLGQLGDGTRKDSSTPIKVMDDVISVSIGYAHTVAIKDDGSLWTWGWNDSGQLGTETTDFYTSTPVKIMDDVVSVSAKHNSTSIIKKDGSLWILGHGVSNASKEMNNAIFTSIGEGYITAIKEDGSLWCWGDNYLGQLGDGNNKSKDVPVKILDNIVFVSAGYAHTAAVKSDGSLWTWGSNEWGQLGDGTAKGDGTIIGGMDENGIIIEEGRTTPIKIMDNVISISSEIDYTIALKNDGSLWIWGDNEYVQLGNGTTEDRYSPVKIMDNVMLPSATDTIAPKQEQSPQPPAEQTQQPTTPKANYIYGEEEKEVVLPTDKLSEVETIKDAQQAAEEAVASMSENDKTSVDGADKAVLFTNEVITRASAVKTSSNSIVINDEMLEETVSKANDAEQKVAQAFNGVRKIRSNSRNARIVTSSEDKISIQKENISKDIDNVEVTTNYAKVSFPAKSVSEISIENKGTNKIAVDFGNKNTTEKVQISFPNMDKNKKYIAVVDENGNAIGGKYNPITGELSAKIEKSGIYTVVDNEKNFEDIKDKSAEMQEAIKLLASKGIISGTSETKFSPDKSISRAEVAAIILRTLSKLDQNADGNFSDVTKQNWYFGAAGSAKNTGIISGYPDNTFRGNVVIPKVQIVSVTSRVLKNEMNYFDVNDAEKILSVYGDSSNIAKWAKNDVALATDVNMVIRRTDSLFGGNDDMARGDAAIILKRLFDKIW